MYQPLDSLRLPSDGGELLRNFKKLGFKYVEDITDEEVLNSNEWKDCLKTPTFTSAWDLCEKEKNVLKVSTTIPALDDALGSGLSPGKIIEFAGDTGSGKTQLCFRISCNFLLEHLETKGEVMYVCTNNNFASHRIKDIFIDQMKLKAEIEYDKNKILQNVLQRINVMEINKIEELVALPLFLNVFLQTHELKLLIIDSIFIPLKSVLDVSRRCIIHRLFADLRKIASEKFPIILTNNLTTRMDKDGNTFHTPSLGENYFHLLNTRFELEKVGKGLHKIKIIKSPGCGTFETTFMIT